jgi:hypothetical protein
MYAKASSSLSAVARVGRVKAAFHRRSQPSWPLFPDGTPERLIPEESLILCAEKDEIIARYSILHGSQQMFASKYMLYLPTEEELRNELARERDQIQARRNNQSS